MFQWIKTHRLVYHKIKDYSETRMRLMIGKPVRINYEPVGWFGERLLDVKVKDGVDDGKVTELVFPDGRSQLFGSYLSGIKSIEVWDEAELAKYRKIRAKRDC